MSHSTVQCQMESGSCSEVSPDSLEKPVINLVISNLSRRMGKPTICKGENKGADQLRSNCEADQRLCFCYTESTIPLLSKSKISSLQPSSVTVQADLCRNWSETQIVGFLTHRLIYKMSGITTIPCKLLDCL